MSERLPPTEGRPEPELPLGLAARLELWQRAGGVVTPLLTTIFAFFMGGLVVLVISGKNPLNTYREIFTGSGINWFGSYCSYPCTSSGNLQQTLIQFTALVLTGLAVAFAFRCGLFNIGGQGQYIVGTVVAVQIGVSFSSLPTAVHVLLAAAAATLAGALWAGIAGILKATVGAHEVISTIMLNWIALWVASYLIGFGGPMQDPAAGPVPVTKEIASSAKLPVVWGSQLLQGLHVGLFVALAALVVYWIVLGRTTLGYEVRAVGFNAEAARYGGISVSRSYFLAMAISGAFAGLAGSLDILGWQYRLDLTSVQTYSQIAFIGIAVALLGRNTAVGVFFAALLFGALKTGTSTRNLDPTVFKPELANNLTQLIQGLVVLFVGADVLILSLWNVRRKLRLPQRKRSPA
ncbi:MAG TPA: ABC transporter permease [Gaiellaceae bacterium]|nr:ABC transporter permease [Gaiellaceae bacterium]